MDCSARPSDLLALVYEGLPRGVRWTRMLEDLRRLLAADGAEVCIHVPALTVNPCVISADGDVSEMRAWLRGRLGTTLLVAGNVSVIVPDDHAGPRLLASRARHGLIATAATAAGAPRVDLRLWREGTSGPLRREVVSDSLRREVGLGPFQREAGELLLWLVPHLQRAAAIACEMTRLEVERAALARALDRLTLAILSVDADLTVRTSNRIALRCLERGDGLRLIDGRLAATHYDDQQRLAQVVRSALTHDGGTVGAVPLRRANGRRPLTLIVEAVPLLTDAPYELSRAVVLFGDPNERAEVDLESLGGLFGLTRAESRVAARLAMGFRLSDAARDLGISHQTARSYLKTVFRKTNTCRQSELVGLLLAGPPSVRSDRSA